MIYQHFIRTSPHTNTLYGFHVDIDSIASLYTVLGQGTLGLFENGISNAKKRKKKETKIGLDLLECN